MDRKSDGVMGLKAALRWLLGTNAEMRTDAARQDAEVVVDDLLKPEENGDRFDRALAKIEQLQQTQKRLDEAVPARTLDEAMIQMAERRRH